MRWREAARACGTWFELVLIRLSEKQNPGQKKFRKSRTFAIPSLRIATQQPQFTMAGIKRKSAGAGAPEVKDKSKKVKVDKPTTKREAKHDVKPVKKAKKAKEERFYGFSAADGADVDMSDAESSEESAKPNGKAQKEPSKKPTSDVAESKLAGLNCKLQQCVYSMVSC
jgi:hypothetical protein